MTDRIAHLRALATDMTQEESYFLSQAEYLKLRKLFMDMTPEALAGMKLAFASESYDAAMPTAKKLVQASALTFFNLEQMASIDKVIDAVARADAYHLVDYPKPEVDA